MIKKINLLTERVWSALCHIHSFLSGHAALRHHGWFLSLLTCKESFRVITFSPHIDASMTRSINSSLCLMPQTQYVYTFKIHFIKGCCVFFYLLGSHNNNCSDLESAACARLTGQERTRNYLRKYVDIQNNIKHMYLRLHCSFTLAGFLNEKILCWDSQKCAP